MGNKKDNKQLKARFERDFDRLRDELGGLQKQALKQVKRLEKEVSGLRDEVVRLAGKPFEGKDKKPASPKPAVEKASGTSKTGKKVEQAKVAAKPADKPKAAKPAEKPKAAAKPAGKPKAAKTPTVAELRKLAKAQGVKGYSTMKKAELLAAVK